MAPKKNKNKENAFYHFMCEMKPNVEKRLKRKVTMAELPDLIYQEWKALSEEEKERFKDMCTDSKKGQEKYDSRGLPLSQLESERESKQTEKDEMLKSIKRTVGMLQAGKAIPNGTFFVICITHYICTDDGTFIPAEIGICQFSLANGILSHYHKILPGQIPLGFKYEAIQHSDQTHKLLLNQCGEAANFREEVEQFLTKDDDKVANVYTQNELMPSVDSMTKHFQLRSAVNVCSLDSLFKHLYSASLIDIPESVATEMLTSCLFDYVSSLPCSWHQQMSPDAGKFCALGLVRRWIFNICDNLRLEETFGIHPQEGRHYPEDAVTAAVCDNFESMNLMRSPSIATTPKTLQMREESSSKDSSSVIHEFARRRNSASSCSSVGRSSEERSGFRKEERLGLAGGHEANKINVDRAASFGLTGFGRGRRNVEK